MLKLILKHEIQSSPTKNIERIVYCKHDQETHEIVLMSFGKTKALKLYMWWLKLMIWKSFDVELSTWRPHDRLNKNPSILALVNRICETLNYIINI